MNNIIVYHKSDLDGHCSGAIARLALEVEQKKQVTMVPAEYGDELPWKDWCNQETSVYILDWSFPKEIMMELYQFCYHLVWIDHHKKTIEKLAEVDQKVDGIRDTNKAACEICWDWFYTNDELPQTVHLLGRYDIWKWHDIPNAIEFQFGMKAEDTDPLDEKSLELWSHLFWPDRYAAFSSPLIRIFSLGQSIMKYQEKSDRTLVQNISFKINFEGHEWIAINGAPRSVWSNVLEKDPDVDLFMRFRRIEDRWIFSMRSKTVRVDEIAEKHGGSGHEHAAGFSAKEIPFTLT